MKHANRRILSFLMATVMLLSLAWVNVFAITEEDGETITISAGNVTVEKSTEAQTVYVSLFIDKDAEVSNVEGQLSIQDNDNLGVTLVGGAEFSVSSMTGQINLTAGMTAGGFAVVDLNAQHHMTFDEALNGYVLVKIPINIPANVVGSVQINFTGLNIGDFDNAMGYELASTSTSATITVTEPSTPSLFTLSAPSYDEENGVAVGETVQLELTINQAFNCAEIVINYPADYVKYQAKEWDDGDECIEEKADGNSLKLLHIGAAKENYTYVLEFKAIAAAETAEFSVDSIKFGTDATIETEDAVKVEQEQFPDPYGIKIVEGYTVELNEIFESENTTVAHGKSFSFTIESKTGEYYENYKVTSVKMGDKDVTTSVTGNATDGWTIANVTGNLVIEGERTAKSYTVTWVDDEIDVIPTETEAKKEATYGTDFAFDMPEKTGYTISVVAKIGENTVGESDEETGQYVIDGTKITGNITITVTATKLEDIEITVEGSNDVVIKGTNGEGLTSTSVTAGTEVTLVLTPAFGYTYSVVVGSGDPVDFNENNEYTFTATATNDDPDETEEIKVIVTKTLNYTANVDQYVQLKDSKSMWLVTIETGDAPLTNEGKNYAFEYTFDNNTVTMSWSDNYKAYAALVIANTDPTNSLTYDLAEVTTVDKITYDHNINGSANNSVDINDAQLVWNMYNQIYDGVTNNVTLEKFWKADVNNDKTINVKDAVVIVDEILGRTAQ